MHVQRAAYCPGLRGAGGESLGLHSWSIGGARLVPVLVDWHVQRKEKKRKWNVPGLACASLCPMGWPP